MLAHCKIVDVSVCASQAAARKAQPLWQQLGFQAKIYERKIKSKVKVATIRIAIDKKSTDILMRPSLLTTFLLRVKVGIYSQLSFVCWLDEKCQII